MKKAVSILMLIVILLSFSGCGKGEEVTEGKNTKNNLEKMSAEEIVDYLQSKITNIKNVIVYNEETDVNKLLGRPNGYTSKVNFADDRVEQSLTSEDTIGGSVEVFETETDCNDRAEYIKSVFKAQKFLGTQYIYQYKNVLLRIDGDLTPTQASEYESVFKELQN